MLYCLPNSNLEGRLQANKIIALLEAAHAAAASLVAGATLPCALEEIVREAQKQWDDEMSAAILLQDDADRFVALVAPDFPATYQAALLASDIGPRSSPFGSAGFSGAPVFSGDIAQDHSWTNGRGVALSHGYRACWALPIFSARGIILGVLGMMFSSSRHPTQPEIALLTLIARASAQVIELDAHAQLRHEHAEMEMSFLACEARLRVLNQAKVAPETAPEAAPESAPETVPETAQEPASRIVLVESKDGALRTTLQHALATLGHQALQAGNAERAMIVLGCGIEIDLLLIHVALSHELAALDLARQAKRLLPGVQILFMSGGQADIDAPVCAADLVFGIDSLNQAGWIDALPRELESLLGARH
jgi:CheY-like chemotaxis protein